jgi:CDP-diglyceride synthetase
MHPINLAGIALGLVAVIGLAFGQSDGWFFSLLALACMLGAVAEAYKENRPAAVAFLVSSGLLALIASVAAYRDSRADRGGT